MIKFCRELADSETFQTFILWVILLTALSMGLEGIPEYEDNYGLWFEIFFYLTQAIFAFEIFVRLLAYSPDYKNFFSKFWNTFDFVIVVGSFMPGPGAIAPIARLFRVLRVIRLVSVSDRLRIFIERMSRTVDELCYSALILFVLGYIFSIAGLYLFSEFDPAHWGSLGRAGISVFYLMLLQDVPSLAGTTVAVSGASVLFFIFFYALYLSFLVNVLGAIVHEHLSHSSSRGKHG